MVIYRFPQESGNGEGTSDRNSSQSGAKTPDFIYVDEERKTTDGAFRSKGTFTEQGEKPRKSYPILLRISTFIISAALTIWTLILCFILAVGLCFAAILLFRPSVALQMSKRMWGVICLTSAYALAFFVSTFSPVFGFGILGLYTMQQGKDVESSIFSRFFRQ